MIDCTPRCQGPPRGHYRAATVTVLYWVCRDGIRGRRHPKITRPVVSFFGERGAWVRVEGRTMAEPRSHAAHNYCLRVRMTLVGYAASGPRFASSVLMKAVCRGGSRCQSHDSPPAHLLLQVGCCAASAACNACTYLTLYHAALLLCGMCMALRHHAWMHEQMGCIVLSLRSHP